MSEDSNLQLSLRRAFRIGYFAFTLAVVAALLTVCLLFGVGDREQLDMLGVPGGTLLALLVGAFGLCVPLFFGVWSMIGTAVLGGFRRPGISEGVHEA